MRIAFAPAVAAALVLLCLPVSALEKRSVPFDDTRADAWTSGATCRVNYYNICTGWVWCWGGFEDDDRIGVVVDRCCEGAEVAYLLQTSLFLCTAAPCYYGFTGTIAVHSVDANDCPIGAPIFVQPYCPTYTAFPFSIVSWPGVAVPNRFAVVVTTATDLGIAYPNQFGSDHPAAGPTGPEACGVCYPADRVTRSYRYGTIASPLCPGERFNDGICDAELFWDFDFSCTVSVQQSSWGSIKSLYR